MRWIVLFIWLHFIHQFNVLPTSISAVPINFCKDKGSNSLDRSMTSGFPDTTRVSSPCINDPIRSFSDSLSLTSTHLSKTFLFVLVNFIFVLVNFMNIVSVFKCIFLRRDYIATYHSHNFSYAKDDL